MATATKAKLLLRELKTVKADLAYAKQRCAQLEEENKILREAYGKGDHPADDEMVYAYINVLQTIFVCLVRVCVIMGLKLRKKNDISQPTT